MQLAGKTALITGAARGIGLATARMFLDQGARVAMVDRDADALTEATSGLTGALPVVCDVSDEAQVAAMIGTVTDAFGGEFKDSQEKINFKPSMKDGKKGQQMSIKNNHSNGIVKAYVENKGLVSIRL